jgi:hypothetical protein
VTRGFLFAVCIVPFIVLATLNSAGYRYGASDQAFYVPAILERLDPGLFPRDSALIHSQAKLTLIDEAAAGLTRTTGLSLQMFFAILYGVTLCTLAWAALSLGGELFATRAAAVALVFALTLRHQITKTGTNTLEGYFHPRQFAFALGALAVVWFLRRGVTWQSIALVAAAGVIHPTTAFWLSIWLGVAAFVAAPRLRPAMAAIAVVLVTVGAWTLVSGPLEGRLVRMDDEWRATLATKDYLFPLEWPASAWAVNLGYIPLIVIGFFRRRSARVLRERELAVMVGCLSLVIVFAGALVLHANRIAIGFQLQPSRIFWMLDFLATVYAIWMLAEDPALRNHALRKPALSERSESKGESKSESRRRAAAVAAIVILLTVVRGSYVAYVRFPERSMAKIDLPDSDWKRAMNWAQATDRGSHWLADPYHAARYGSSLRVAGRRDVFVEEIKDSAIGMYERDVAVRTRDRMAALGDFDSLTEAGATELASRFDLDYLIAEKPLGLPVAFRSGTLTVYRLR